MKPYRSSLFVPGNRAAWMEKAVGYGADCLILDLEDSVPDQEKIPARPLVREAIKFLHAKGQAVNVRINGFATGLALDDLEAVLTRGLSGVALPKVETVEDMKQLDVLLTHLERRLGLPAGVIETPLDCETAKGMRNIYDIVTQCPRVKRVMLAAGPGGDAARAMISSWWNIKDLEGLEKDCRWNRQLGFRGQTVMHPSHVPIANKVFTPTSDELAYYEGLLQAMEEAQRKGVAAVTYKGDMVDEAMAKTARGMLDFAKSIDVTA